MSEQLSGRPLEIATAKALGMKPWGVSMSDNQTHYGLRKEGEAFPGPFTDTLERVWEVASPRYLTDGNAFDSVLAALCAEYEIHHHVAHGSALPQGPNYCCALFDGEGAQIGLWEGETLAEAACRALIAWKAKAGSSRSSEP